MHRYGIVIREKLASASSPAENTGAVWHCECCFYERRMASLDTSGLRIASAREKSTTKHIVISEPDEQQLQSGIEGRNLAPELVTFLKRLLKASRWTRIINIPSCRNDLAAVIVFTSAL